MPDTKSLASLSALLAGVAVTLPGPVAAAAIAPVAVAEPEMVLAKTQERLRKRERTVEIVVAVGEPHTVLAPERERSRKS